MGLAGISKSQVSKLCKEIDERVRVFLDGPLEGEWPYLWLDATYLKVRSGGRTARVHADRKTASGPIGNEHRALVERLPDQDAVMTEAPFL